MFILAVNRFDKGVFYGTGYFSVIRCPVFDVLQHFVEPKYVFGTHKVVTKHDEVHFSIYFLQSFHECISIAPLSFYSTEGMFADALPSFIVIRILPDVFIVPVYGILIFAAMNNAFIQFGAVFF